MPNNAASIASDPAVPTSYARRLARVLGGFALGSVSVVLLAVGLYLWRADARQADLKEHYERQAARIARQISLRLEHYRQFADSSFRERPPRTDGTTGAANGADRVSGAKLQRVACEPEDPIAAVSLSRDRSALLFPSAARAAGECLRLPISALFVGLDEEPASFGQEREFDEVALLDASRTVVFAHARSSRIRLPAGEKEESKLPIVTLGSEEYHAFRQSVGTLGWRVVAPGSPPDGSWITDVAPGPKLEVRGLVRKARLDTDARQVNPAYFLWAVLVLAIGLLALPLGKLWLLGPQARFRRSNALSLLASAVLGAALGIVLLLAFFARARMRLDLEARLAQVAEELAASMEEHIDESARLLDLAATRQTPPPPLAYALEPSALTPEPATCSGIIAVDRPIDDAVRGCAGFSWWDSWQEPMPPWHSVFWADSRGEQRLKYMKVPAGELTPMVNVSRRDYFKRALAGRLESLACPRDPWLSGAVEIVRSMTTGQIVLIVARPTYASGAPAERAEGVLAVATRMPALQRQVLPLGFQTAVLDADGKVMLHSNNDAHQGETFFDDLDDGGELRALILARLSEYVSFEYLGSRSRAYTRPLRGDWSLVVIADAGLIDYPTRYMILLSLGMLAAAGISLGLLFGVLVRVRASLRREWADARGCPAPTVSSGRLFRPDGTRAVHYFVVGSCTLAGGWLAIAAACHMTPGLPAVAASVGGLLVAACMLFVGARVRRYVEGAYRARARGWLLRVGYALYCGGLTTALVTAPAAVIFACTYDELIEIATRANQDHLARELRRHPECLEPSECRELAVLGFEDRPLPRTPALKTAQLLPDLSPRTLLQGVSVDGAWLHPLRYVLDQLPPLTGLSEASGRLYRVHAETRRLGWNWHRTTAALELKLTQGGTHRARLPFIFELERTSVLSLAVLIGSVFMIAAVSYLAYLSLARLLFLRLIAPVPPSQRQPGAAGPASAPPIAPAASGAPATSSPLDRHAALLAAWRELSFDEQRVLAQLAVDGYVAPHPENGPALQKLAHAGLLDGATLTIPTRELSEIARTNFPAERLDECEQAGGSSAWTLLRGPLAAGVGVLLLSFGFTQADLTTAGLTIPSALSIIPLLLRMFGAASAAKP